MTAVSGNTMAAIFSSLNINSLIFNSLSLSHYVTREADSTTGMEQTHAIFTGKANPRHGY